MQVMTRLRYMEWLNKEVDNENRDIRFAGRALKGYPQVFVSMIDETTSLPIVVSDL